MRRRDLFAFLIVLILTVLPPLSAYAGTPGTAAIVTSVNSIMTGDIFPVSVMAGNLTDLYSIDLGITFDPTKLEVVSSSGSLATTVTPGDIFSSVQGITAPVANSADNLNGKIIYSCRIKTMAEGGQDQGIDITGQKSVITFYFKAISAGESTQVGFDPSFASAEGHGILFSDSDTDDIALSKTSNLILKIGSTAQPVASIAVTAAGNVTTVATGSTIQMSAIVLPANATDQGVVWFVTPGSGNATITQEGLLTGTAPGDVIVIATAHDGSGVTGTLKVTVNASVQTPGASNPVGGGGGGGAAATDNPAVQTGDATKITVNSAVLNGDIVSNGGIIITEYGFIWGADQNSLVNILKIGTGNHTGSFSATLDKLATGTSYYYRAFAESAGGTFSGDVKQFTLAKAGGATPPVPATLYFDVPASHWAYEAIDSLSSQGCISGYPGGVFRPENEITRAEFISIICKAMKLPAYSPAAQDFNDISTGDWFYGSVERAVYADLIKGYGSSFAPGKAITREELACIMVSAMGKQDEAKANMNEKTSFIDGADISAWARGSVAVAVKYGLIKGYQNPEGSYGFKPQGEATRAEACAIIRNFMEYRLFGRR